MVKWKKYEDKGQKWKTEVDNVENGIGHKNKG